MNRLLVIGAPLVLASATPVEAQFSFTEQTDLLGEVSLSGAPMAVVDMNGDGRDDLEGRRDGSQQAEGTVQTRQGSEAPGDLQVQSP